MAREFSCKKKRQCHKNVLPTDGKAISKIRNVLGQNDNFLKKKTQKSALVSLTSRVLCETI